MKRATIAEIRQYDWFKINLPNYLFPDDGSTNSDNVNEEALAEVFVLAYLFCDCLLYFPGIYNYVSFMN